MKGALCFFVWFKATKQPIPKKLFYERGRVCKRALVGYISEIIFETRSKRKCLILDLIQLNLAIQEEGSEKFVFSQIDIFEGKNTQLFL